MEMVRCQKIVKKQNWQCPRLFPKETRRSGGKMVDVKRCPHCRGLNKKYNDSEKGKTTVKEYQGTEKYKEVVAKSNKSPFRKENKVRHMNGKGKTTRKAYQETEAYKESAKRWLGGPKGAIYKKKKGAMFSARIRRHFYKLLSGSMKNSALVKRVTAFRNGASFKRHIRTTFAGNMSVQNYGTSDGSWQVGHKIAVAMYDHENAEDVRRCWSPENMFAQDSKENRLLGVKLPNENDLLALRTIWPKGWKDVPLNQASRKIAEFEAGRGSVYIAM